MSFLKNVKYYFSNRRKEKERKQEIRRQVELLYDKIGNRFVDAFYRIVDNYGYSMLPEDFKILNCNLDFLTLFMNFRWNDFVFEVKRFPTPSAFSRNFRKRNDFTSKLNIYYRGIMVSDVDQQIAVVDKVVDYLEMNLDRVRDASKKDVDLFLSK